jgi:hypothetical protein
MKITIVDSPETIKAREPFLRILRDMEAETESKMHQRGLSDRELATLHREHLIKTQPIIDQLAQLESRCADRYYILAS